MVARDGALSPHSGETDLSGESAMSPEGVLSSRWSAPVFLLLLGSGATAFADVLSITKTGLGGVKPGDDAAYTIVVSNTGPGDILGVALDDPTPSGLSLVSVSGDCTAFPCTFATLASGATKTVTARFSLPLGYNGPNPIVNTAVARPAAGDAVAATASTAVLRVAGFHSLPPCRIVDTRAQRRRSHRRARLSPGAAVPHGRRAGGLRPARERHRDLVQRHRDQPTVAGRPPHLPRGASNLPSLVDQLRCRPDAGQQRDRALERDGTLSVSCDQAAGDDAPHPGRQRLLRATDEVATPVGQNVTCAPLPEVEITFDNVTPAGVDDGAVLEFADNRPVAGHPRTSSSSSRRAPPERALVPSVVVPELSRAPG